MFSNAMNLRCSAIAGLVPQPAAMTVLPIALDSRAARYSCAAVAIDSVLFSSLEKRRAALRSAADRR